MCVCLHVGLRRCSLYLGANVVAWTDVIGRMGPQAGVSSATNPLGPEGDRAFQCGTASLHCRPFPPSNRPTLPPAPLLLGTSLVPSPHPPTSRAGLRRGCAGKLLRGPGFTRVETEFGISQLYQSEFANGVQTESKRSSNGVWGFKRSSNGV
jgi:hypothetical protein